MKTCIVVFRCNHIIVSLQKWDGANRDRVHIIHKNEIIQ